MSKDLDLTTCQTVDSTFLHKKGLCGLCNLGNTCFMNSIIQCLNNTLPLLEYFVQNEYLKDINKQSSDFNITNEWNLVCRGLWHKNALVNPKKFHSAIRLRAIERDYDDFTGFGQNDSQEFLQFLLESLHNSLSKKVNMNIVGKPENDLDKIASGSNNGSVFEGWRYDIFGKNALLLCEGKIGLAADGNKIKIVHVN